MEVHFEVIMCHTRDVPRYETKESLKANKSTVTGQNTFLLPAATPNHDMTQKFGHPQKSVPSHHTKFGVDISNLLIGCLVDDFDWLYRTNGFENQICLRIQ